MSATSSPTDSLRRVAPSLIHWKTLRAFQAVDHSVHDDLAQNLAAVRRRLTAAQRAPPRRLERTDTSR